MINCIKYERTTCLRIKLATDFVFINPFAQKAKQIECASLLINHIRCRSREILFKNLIKWNQYKEYETLFESELSMLNYFRSAVFYQEFDKMVKM